MIYGKRTTTGYLLEKRTRKGTWRFFMRDVDGKVFLEAKREITFVSIECTPEDLQAIERFCKAIREGGSSKPQREIWRGKVKVSLLGSEAKREMGEGGAYDKITEKAFDIAGEEVPDLLVEEYLHYSFSYSPDPKAGLRTYEVLITEAILEED